MGKWFPAIYDIAMKPLEDRSFSKIRGELIHKASGRVLEIGSGTGINFPYYKNVEQVDAIEPNPQMMEKSIGRKKLASVPIHTHIQSAENLPFLDNTFDTAVATLVFCTIPDPVLALKEIRRVCKQQATVLFFEHVKMPHPLFATLQDAVTPVWKIIGDGCHLNRDTLEIIKSEGFQINNMKTFYHGLFIVVECQIA